MIFLRCKFVAYHTNSEQIVLWHQHLIVGWRNGRLTLSAPHYRMSHPGSPAQYQACTASTHNPEFVQVMRIKELQGYKSLENLRLSSQQLPSIKTRLTQLLRPIKIIRIIFGLVLPTLHASRKYFCFHEREGWGSYHLNFPLKNYLGTEASSELIIPELVFHLKIFGAFKLFCTSHIIKHLKQSYRKRILYLPSLVNKMISWLSSDGSAPAKPVGDFWIFLSEPALVSVSEGTFH